MISGSSCHLPAMFGVLSPSILVLSPVLLWLSEMTLGPSPRAEQKTSQEGVVNSYCSLSWPPKISRLSLDRLIFSLILFQPGEQCLCLLRNRYLCKCTGSGGGSFGRSNLAAQNCSYNRSQSHSWFCLEKRTCFVKGKEPEMMPKRLTLL